MKKIVYSILISTSLFLTGCSGDNDPNNGEFHDDPSAGYVYFNRVELADQDEILTLDVPVACFQEGGQAMYPFMLDAFVNNSLGGVNVNFDIVDVKGSSAGVNVSANVPSGSLQGNIVVDYPAGMTSSSFFDVIFTSTDKSNVGVGVPGTTTEEKVRVRLNVDTRDLLFGTYDAVEISGGTPSEYEVVITPGEADNEIHISHIGDSFGGDKDDFMRAFVNEDGTFSFPSPADNYAFFNEPNSLDLYYDGQSGTHVGCPGEINLSVAFRVGSPNGGATAPISVTLTRQGMEIEE